MSKAAPKKFWVLIHATGPQTGEFYQHVIGSDPIYMKRKYAVRDRDWYNERYKCIGYSVKIVKYTAEI